MYKAGLLLTFKNVYLKQYQKKMDIKDVVKVKVIYNRQVTKYSPVIAGNTRLRIIVLDYTFIAVFKKDREVTYKNVLNSKRFYLKK